MQLNGLLDVLRNTPAYQNLLDYLRGGTTVDDLSLGVLRAARPYVLAALATDWDGPIIFVTARPENAYNAAEQLPVWLPDDRITRFSEPSAAFYERSSWGESATSGRMAALAALMQDDGSPTVVSSARALMQRTLPANAFRQATVRLKEGGHYDLIKLLEDLNGIGYVSTSLVADPGTYSRRGGIVDVYPITATEPYRIDFFDDEIDSIRPFDPTSQRSERESDVREVAITPAREALPSLTPSLVPHLKNWFQSLSADDERDDATSPIVDVASLEAGTVFPFIEHYLPYIYDNPVSLLDYATDDALVVVDDWDDLRDTVQMLEDDAETVRADKLGLNELPPDYPQPYIPWERIKARLQGRKLVRLGATGHVDRDMETAVGVGPTLFGGLFGPGERFGGMLKPMLRKVHDLREKQDRIVIVTEQATRISELWKETEGYASVVKQITEMPEPGAPIFLHGVLREGWTVSAGDGTNLHLLTDAEVFGWRRAEPRRRKVAKRAKTGARVEYTDWEEGAYVVHEDYGVGRFAGMRRRTIEGNQREYLLVDYNKGAQLFVPIHQADRLTRYVGTDDSPPALTRLGGKEWENTKSKAQKNVEEEAKQLLGLYAARAKAPGYGFSDDTPWQNELEASFPYIETQDQLQAVQETKKDMQAPHPMDRLVCGDAGYGKTEVAVRAAFKAIQDGKQVAVLVPTTVLAQQHYETFKERMVAFPIQTELLSRFRTNTEQNKTVDRLASGEVDIVVGTHRILSKDIRFKDLGLVIIDEEQRFGVKQKEHFKSLRTQVDVLTLTATPIPRTMQMALSGVRDISMIQTPPEERLPVITHVGAFDRSLIRMAIMRETERGGQVFFVHNRVRTIQSVREQLEEIVPEARVVVAHGQMDGRTLGGIMRAFARGEYDVLLSTSIVESGIDIPNANTLIIDRADWFGLAQLYQIRGRVGRSAQQAYAYIFHPPASKLNAEARARLETIAENTQLGAGFQIALRDLEIRGAGNILSTKQSGHVTAVGLLLYTQMLANAVEDLKQESPDQDEREDEQRGATDGSVIIDLPTPAYLPTDWIPEMALRLQIYRRVAALETREGIQRMREELQDRFGNLPPAVEGLLYQIDIKVLAREAGATAVQHRKETVKIRLPYLPKINRDRLAAQLGEGVQVTRTAIEMPLYLEDMGSWQSKLVDLLERLSYRVDTAVSN